MKDVADIISKPVGLAISLHRIPGDGIEQSFRDLGFYTSTARAYKSMTLATIDAPGHPRDFIGGDMSLGQYLETVI
ncbi:hypothetical protein GAO09_10720 [Rhizobiales bacterium RZME27]|uniref:Uncharacterized protein n=1 Tax=Endobacterium cereale TaxID=2663029 RepID=A0A6A8A9G9_9HYPH|nr:hypothetical protein [Endobacterium cereale]MEB2846764.1 hypothetical protein [Endobacterium cereale]MQY46517.1 hypothetical protein [Endobacterium cereale]